MKAVILVQGCDYDIWEGFDDASRKETTCLVGEGESIETTGLGATVHFEIVAIRSDAVDLAFRPYPLLVCSEKRRYVDTLTLHKNEPVALQTPTIDVWGTWLVTLQGIV
jgi:hypothetical protein